VAGLIDGTTWMFNVKDKICEHVFTGHYQSVTCGAYILDGAGLVTGSEDGSMYLWDLSTFGAKSHLTGICLKQGSSFLYVIYSKSPLESSCRQFHRGPITCLDTHRNGSMILSGSDDASIKLVHAQTGQVSADYPKGLIYNLLNRYTMRLGSGIVNSTS
jgi:WD40 repeat protein